VLALAASAASPPAPSCFFHFLFERLQVTPCCHLAWLPATVPTLLWHTVTMPPTGTRLKPAVCNPEARVGRPLRCI